MRTALITLVVGFGLGATAGSFFPRHHYVRAGNGTQMYDERTGRVCEGVKHIKAALPAGYVPETPADQIDQVPYCGSE